MANKSILDLTTITDGLQATDKLYVVRGTGVGRDRQVAAASLVPVTITQDIAGAIALASYVGDVCVVSTPVASIAITTTGALLSGRRLTIINASAFDITVDGNTVPANSTGIAVSDGTAMSFVSAGGAPVPSSGAAINYIANGELSVWEEFKATAGAGIYVPVDADHKHIGDIFLINFNGSPEFKKFRDDTFKKGSNIGRISLTGITAGQGGTIQYFIEGDTAAMLKNKDLCFGFLGRSDISIYQISFSWAYPNAKNTISGLQWSAPEVIGNDVSTVQTVKKENFKFDDSLSGNPIENGILLNLSFEYQVDDPTNIILDVSEFQLVEATELPNFKYKAYSEILSEVQRFVYTLNHPDNPYFYLAIGFKHPLNNQSYHSFPHPVPMLKVPTIIPSDVSDFFVTDFETGSATVSNIGYYYGNTELLTFYVDFGAGLSGAYQPVVFGTNTAGSFLKLDARVI